LNISEKDQKSTKDRVIEFYNNNFENVKKESIKIFDVYCRRSSSYYESLFFDGFLLDTSQVIFNNTKKLFHDEISIDE